MGRHMFRFQDMIDGKTDRFVFKFLDFLNEHYTEAHSEGNHQIKAIRRFKEGCGRLGVEGGRLARVVKTRPFRLQPISISGSHTR